MSVCITRRSEKGMELVIFFSSHGQRQLTQYTRAQYQHSTRKGNFRSRRLSSRSLNTSVLGEDIVQDRPRISSCRLCHRSSEICGIGEQDRALKRPSLDVGLEHPDSRESRESACTYSEDCRRIYVCENAVLVTLLIQVPPKRSTITAKGSRIAPAPMTSSR
jgi:hypothetical protein